MPFWQNGGDWYENVLGGWQVSGITTLQSRRPINWAYRATSQALRFFNTAAFANPANGVFGNLGPQRHQRPGTNNWDVSQQKLFSLGERYKLDFRGEIYNAPHHFNYFAVATTVGAANFGQVTSATDPSAVQLGLRFSF